MVRQTHAGCSFSCCRFILALFLHFYAIKYLIIFGSLFVHCAVRLCLCLCPHPICIVPGLQIGKREGEKERQSSRARATARASSAISAFQVPARKYAVIFSTLYIRLRHYQHLVLMLSDFLQLWKYNKILGGSYEISAKKNILTHWNMQIKKE